MKNNLYIIFLLFSIGLFSQIEDPIEWTTSVKKVSETEYILISKATIEDGWHLYSQTVPEDGPIPTTFTYDTSKENFSLIEKTNEDEGHTVDDPVFNMKIKFFENSAIFQQKITVSSGLSVVNGVVEFMVCDDTKCLAPTEFDLVFNFGKGINLNSNKSDTLVLIDNKVTNNQLYGINTSNLSLSSVKCKDELTSKSSEIKEQGNSLWNIFGLGFLGGLLALLTPCVFPMIPLTVSFFTKKNGQNKGSGVSKALLYGFFIFAVYVILSVPFHLLDSVNPDILNEISTNIWLNIIFFVIFVFFAF